MVIDILKEANVLLDGHFLLSSGRHSDQYCQCAKLFEQPEKAKVVVAEVAKKLHDVDYDLIVGPAMGGVIAAYELAVQTGKRNIFMERVDGKMTMKRGFEIEPGTKAIIMEDVITTGKSSLEVVKVIEEYGGEVVAFACIVDRLADQSFELPVYSAIKLTIPSFLPEECPQCQKGIPYVKPGSRNIK